LIGSRENPNTPPPMFGLAYVVVTRVTHVTARHAPSRRRLATRDDDASRARGPRSRVVVDTPGCSGRGPV